MDTPIRMSVVVVWRDAREALDDCLRSLREQLVAVRGELIVVSSLPESAFEAVRAGMPEVRLVRVEPPLTEPRAWEAGAAVARGAIVAFAQARCRYAPGWAQAALAACVPDTSAPPKLVSGPVLPEPGMALPARVVYLCDYASFADPEGEGGGRAASNNLALDRRTLRNESAAASRKCARGLDKASLLLAGRCRVAWAPAMQATTRVVRSFDADTLARFHRGRHFASLRSTDWPRLARLAAGAGCVVLPIVLYVRMIANRFLRKQFAGTLAFGLPYLAVALGGWSLGEMAGYWAGPGRSERFL